ncbi:MAG: alpha/beta hydrolase, partial [Methanoregulaceae archaeon]|nr:alpha/beta hydrolase [Methanoregulaceae archaeon]
MNKTQLFTLVIALTICLLAIAGCTGTSGTAAQPQVVATQAPPAVSFNATPVQYAQVNGVTLGYREFGSGEPVLMVQGFGATINDWNETFIGILASKYHVYTYDHRGMGYSSDNKATPTISLYSDDAALLMPALGYASMHVYGVSMGSSIS